MDSAKGVSSRKKKENTKSRHQWVKFLFFLFSVLENRVSTDEEIVDRYCFYVRYEIPEKAGGGDWSDEYLARIRK